VHEVTPWASNFPDPFVGFVPRFGEKRHHGPFEGPRGLVDRNAATPAEMERVYQLAITSS
jgi:hypothetical protein